MIFVDRSSQPIPPSLTTAAAKRARKEIVDVLASAEQRHLRQLSFRFKNGLWLDARASLAALFHGKCAYCESMSSRASYEFDIEHFRPKQSAQGIEGREGEHLYYAWLAYEWDNLLLACPACNRMRRRSDRITGKGNRFPVTGPRARLRATIKECRTKEKETLLDPCYDQPAEHLTFDPNGTCVPLSKRGSLTIEVLDLNRAELVDQRRTVMMLVSTRLEELVRPKGSAARRKLLAPTTQAIIQMVAASAPYAAAARSQLELTCSSFVGMPLRWASHSEDQVESALLNLLDAAPTQVMTAVVAPLARYVDEVASTVKTDAPRRFTGRRNLPPHALRWLSRIEITDFKALENISIDVPEPSSDLGDQAPALMLLGENAAGKSSILEAVGLALLGTEQIKRLGIDGKDYLRRDDKWKLIGKSARIRLILNDDARSTIELNIDARSGEFRGPGFEQMVLLGYGPRRYFSNTKAQRRPRGTAARLKTLFDPTAIITNPTAWLMNSSDHDYDATVRALRQLLLLEEMSFVARPPRGKRAGKEIIFQFEGKSTPLKRLSEGYRTVVATGVDVMREMLDFWPNLEMAQGVVLIDELDTHLHPRWKMRILQRLRGAMPRVQFICTTHDPLCLRGMFDGEVQVLRRLEGSPIEQVIDLPNVQGLTVEQLLISDYFGLMSTEDPSVEEEMIRYVALATKERRTSEEEEELEMHREKAQRRIRLGSTPQEQLLVEAANAFVIKERDVPSAQRATLRRDTAKKMLDIWSLVDRRPTRS
jgi:uncharacterized protein (TIGR02646 family)